MRTPDDQAVSVGVFGLGHAAVVAVRARRNARFTTLSLPVFPLHHQGFGSSARPGMRGMPARSRLVGCAHGRGSGPLRGWADGWAGDRR